MAHQLQITVLGAGSIGLLFVSSLLSVAPKNVRLLSRRTPSSRFGDNKFQITLNDPLSSPILIPEINAKDYTNVNNEILLVATKCYDAVSAVQSLLPFSSSCPQPTIVLLCNGSLGLKEQLAKIDSLDSSKVVFGSTTNGAVRNGSNVNHLGVGQNWFEQPEPDVTANANKDYKNKTTENSPLSSLKDILDKSNNLGKTTLLHSSSIKPLLYEKLAANCVINPLSAIHKVKNGDVLEAPGARETFAAVVDEIATCAAQEGVDLGEDPTTRLANFVLEVIDDTRENKSSMLIDVEMRRKTEVDYFNGWVADQLPTTTSSCRMLYTKIKMIEKDF